MRKKTKKFRKLKQQQNQIYAWLFSNVDDCVEEGNVTYEALLRSLMDAPDCPVTKDELPCILFHVWGDPYYDFLAPINETQAVRIAKSLGFNLTTDTFPMTSNEQALFSHLGKKEKRRITGIASLKQNIRWIDDYITRHIGSGEVSFERLFSRLLADPDCPASRSERVFIFPTLWDQKGLPPPSDEELSRVSKVINDALLNGDAPDSP